MKNLKTLLIFVVVLLLAANCKKDELPEYVGNWTNNFINYGIAGADTQDLFNYKELMILKENSYEVILSIKYTDVFIPFISEKGKLSKDGDELVFVIEEYGETSLNSQGRATGNLSVTDITDYPENQRTDKKTFNLNGNELIIYNGDFNMDGDKDDFGENTTYTKSY